MDGEMERVIPCDFANSDATTAHGSSFVVAWSESASDDTSSNAVFPIFDFIWGSYLCVLSVCLSV